MANLNKDEFQCYCFLISLSKGEILKYAPFEGGRIHEIDLAGSSQTHALIAGANQTELWSIGLNNFGSVKTLVKHSSDIDFLVISPISPVIIYQTPMANKAIYALDLQAGNPQHEKEVKILSYYSIYLEVTGERERREADRNKIEIMEIDCPQLGICGIWEESAGEGLVHYVAPPIHNLTISDNGQMLVIDMGNVPCMVLNLQETIGRESKRRLLGLGTELGNAIREMNLNLQKTLGKEYTRYVYSEEFKKQLRDLRKKFDPPYLTFFSNPPQFPLHTDFYLSSFAFSPDGICFISAASLPLWEYNNEIQSLYTSLMLWKIDIQEMLWDFDRYLEAVQDVAFLHDGRRVISAGLELHLWDIVEKKSLGVLVRKETPYVKVKVSDKDSWLVAANREESKTPYAKVKISQKGNWIVAANKAGTIEVWDIESRQLIQQIDLNSCTDLIRQLEPGFRIYAEEPKDLHALYEEGEIKGRTGRYLFANGEESAEITLRLVDKDGQTITSPINSINLFLGYETHSGSSIDEQITEPLMLKPVKTKMDHITADNGSDTIIAFVKGGFYTFRFRGTNQAINPGIDPAEYLGPKTRNGIHPDTLSIRIVNTEICYNIGTKRKEFLIGGGGEHGWIFLTSVYRAELEIPEVVYADGRVVDGFRLYNVSDVAGNIVPDGTIVYIQGGQGEPFGYFVPGGAFGQPMYSIAVFNGEARFSYQTVDHTQDGIDQTIGLIVRSHPNVPTFLDSRSYVHPQIIHTLRFFSNGS